MTIFKEPRDREDAFAFLLVLVLLGIAATMFACGEMP